jgi:hypothetical protein
VLFINNKSVLVSRNVTLCYGFVGILVLVWESYAGCVGRFCFRVLSFLCAECCLVNKHSAAHNSPCYYTIWKSFTQQAEFRHSTPFWTPSPIQIPNNPLPVMCVTVTFVAKVVEGSLYIFSHISFPCLPFFSPFFVKSKVVLKQWMKLRDFGFFWGITQGWVVIPYRRFGTTYRFHLQR